MEIPNYLSTVIRKYIKKINSKKKELNNDFVRLQHDSELYRKNFFTKKGVIKKSFV